ncbi:hypothetical protein ACIQWA_13455 [Kitasatospora sp. NPDC098652]|uniref:hypothetical protein n=1 Tax=Kitasatospora sp. NPDC098652 TaxID=3364095 RepID=UPI0037F7C371
MTALVECCQYHLKLNLADGNSFHFASGEKIVRKALSTVLLVIAAFMAVTVVPAEAAGTHPVAGTVVSAAVAADIPLCC